ncbi:hypothetical protein HDV00_012190 [Rhizophlyctis rosea]|nr:hypothetical protein HDV00_012190 [Rhizophlyctis rosea]
MTGTAKNWNMKGVLVIQCGLITYPGSTPTAAPDASHHDGPCAPSGGWFPLIWDTEFKAYLYRLLDEEGIDLNATDGSEYGITVHSVLIRHGGLIERPVGRQGGTGELDIIPKPIKGSELSEEEQTPQIREIPQSQAEAGEVVDDLTEKNIYGVKGLNNGNGACGGDRFGHHAILKALIPMQGFATRKAQARKPPFYTVEIGEDTGYCLPRYWLVRSPFGKLMGLTGEETLK